MLENRLMPTPHLAFNSEHEEEEQPVLYLQKNTALLLSLCLRVSLELLLPLFLSLVLPGACA